MIRVMLRRALSLSVLFLFLAALAATAQVRLVRNGEQVDVTINGTPFTSLHFGSDYAKPFLYPIRSVNGTALTRGFPLEIVPGEDKSDPHQRGLWIGHGDVNGVDFWTEGDGKGRIVLRTLGRLVGGAEAGSLTAEFEWRDATGRPLVEEVRTMTFTQVVSENLIDIESTLRPAGAEKIVFGDTKNGTFAVRLSNALSERTEKCPNCPGHMTNSEGGRGEKEIWGKHANWVDLSGEVEGQRWGVAMFDHPANHAHPAAWHARAYGLIAANPFGAREFSPGAAGGMAIQPGSSLTFRYRVVVHSGDAIAARISQQYLKWVVRPLAGLAPQQSFAGH